MAGGLLVGLSNEDAARFAFLLATPIIGAAARAQAPGPVRIRRQRRARPGARGVALRGRDGLRLGALPDALLRDEPADAVRGVLRRRGIVLSVWFASAELRLESAAAAGARSGTRRRRSRRGRPGTMRRRASRAPPTRRSRARGSSARGSDLGGTVQYMIATAMKRSRRGRRTVDECALSAHGPSIRGPIGEVLAGKVPGTGLAGARHRFVHGVCGGFRTRQVESADRPARKHAPEQEPCHTQAGRRRPARRRLAHAPDDVLSGGVDRRRRLRADTGPSS